MNQSYKYLLSFLCIIATAATQNTPRALADEIGAPASETRRDTRFVVGGTVYDSATGEPIPHATVQAAGTGMACKANADGRYRLILGPGEYEIKATHIGYQSVRFTISLFDSSVTRDVRLAPAVLDMGERKVYSRAYDPAQRIIAEAIRHKKDILSQIHDYSFDAYAKFVLRETARPDTENIFLIAESQTACFWEQPDQYKEIITARRNTANIDPENVIVGIGELLNFNRDRIDFGDCSVVSPTARDAMDHYNYYLLDTVILDNRPVFVLEIEPKNEYEPLFAGEIQIIDSTFDVVKVDVRFTKGLRLPFLSNGRYSQSLAMIEDRYWLPVQIGFAGDVTFNVPILGIPSKLNFDYVASVYDYRIDRGHREGTFGEYELEIDEKADEVDSAVWAARQTIPLTELEIVGYERIDSLENLPKPVYKHLLKGLGAALFLVTFGDYDLFHFNRVDGPYAGIGLDPQDWIPNTRLRIKTGYAFDDKNWQYEYGISHRLWEKYKLWVGGSIKDEIVHRPTIISSPSYNPTANALLFKFDPFDYHREKGYSAYVAFKPAGHTRLRIAYRDYRHLSKSKTTDYGIFRRSIMPRDNPPVVERTMRSFALTLRYDSRKLIRNKDRDEIGFSDRYFRVEFGLEYASPDVADNDFDFRRYYVRLRGRFDLPGAGPTSLSGYVGSSDGMLPPQRYFIVDFHDPNFFEPTGFNTSHETNFAGDRAAAVYASHDFGPYVFRNTGIRFLKGIPFGLTVHGGAMWTAFHREPILHDSSVRSAPTAYMEIGFGLDNLTPFLMPFNLALDFTWQLSDYNTRSFSIMIDFKL